MESTNEIADLMAEPPVGENHGRQASRAPEREGRHVPLSPIDQQARQLLQAGGWSLVDPEREGRVSGMTAHRGPLQGDEFVDHEAIVAGVESALGFSFDAVHAVYRQGRLSAAQQEARAAIDARLLELQRGGANMALLARVLGFKGSDGAWPTALVNALRRARAAEEGAPMSWYDDHYPGSSDYPRTGDEPTPDELDPWVLEEEERP